jgi:undecaprenyl pyrophosphate phosphatase UppP
MTSVIVFQHAAPAALAASGCPAHITYGEASAVGLIQGLSELFPVSSLGHNVLIPALAGGCWARNLNVAAPESPYLAFIVQILALLAGISRDGMVMAGGMFRGQTLLASVLAGAGGYLALRFLVRYLRTRALTPFAIYSLVFGAGSIVYLELIR